jgi:glycosyltransferase involved in cell wall biosynthesis
MSRKQIPFQIRARKVPETASQIEFSLICLGHRGGSENFLKTVAKNLVVHGYKVEIHTSTEIKSESLWVSAFESRSYSIPHSLSSLLRSTISTPKNLIRLIWNLKNRENAIFVMPQPLDFFILMGLKLFTKVTTVYTIHDLEPHLGERWPTRRAISRRIRLSDKLIFVSEGISQIYLSSKLPRRPFSVIPLTVSEPDADYKTTQLFSLDSKYYVIAGRMQPYKGVADFLDAWNRYLKSSPEISRLLVAGVGAEQYFDSKVTFPNIHTIDRWLLDEELWNLIYYSNGVILPYKEATQSGIAEIALFLGKPILATNVGSLPEQLHGVANATVSDLNTGALSDALKNFVNFKDINTENRNLMQSNFGLKLGFR